MLGRPVSRPASCSQAHPQSPQGEKLEIALASVIHCENALGIDSGERWTLDSTMCLDAFKAAAEHAYRRALDRLSHAVVQRILELHKMGLPGTCKCTQ